MSAPNEEPDSTDQPGRPPVALALLAMPLVAAAALWAALLARRDDWPARLDIVLPTVALAGPPLVAIVVSVRRRVPLWIAVLLAIASVAVLLLLLYLLALSTFLGCDPPGGDDPCSQ